MADWNQDTRGPTTQPIKRTAKIIQNGEPGQYQVHWGLIEKAVVSLVVTILAGLLMVGIPTLIATYREVGELRATQEIANREAVEAAGRAAAAAQTTSDRLEQHIQWSQEKLLDLVTKEDLDREIGRKRAR